MELLPHPSAFERLWLAAEKRVHLHHGPVAERTYPDSGGWHWTLTESGDLVQDPLEQDWLNSRFRLLERLFVAFGTLLPHIRAGGTAVVPRPVEGWEWSCIGKHALWRSWTERGPTHADLRPALLDLIDGDGFEEPEKEEYELFYPVQRVEALALELTKEKRRPGRTPKSAPWHKVLRAYATDHGLGPEHSPETLLKHLMAQGQVRRHGRYVSVFHQKGVSRVRTSTFRHAARLVLLDLL